MRILLEHGANVNARNNDGITPLGRLRNIKKSFDEREYHSCEFDFARAEELLLEYGAKQ
jgi:ankyrin repeat protein